MQLYMSMLRKHIGWFDHQENYPGQLTSLLSEDTQTVSRVSSESITAMIEGMFQIMIGL